MANGRDINVRLTVRDDGSVVLRNFGRQVERTSKRGEKSFNRMNRASTVASRGIRDLATSFGLLGGAVGVAAFALPITAAVRATNNLDVALAGVRAVTQGTTSDMAELEAQARSLGATTQFSASQAAEAQEFLARAGFQLNEILAATPGTLDLAAAGSLNLARAADISSNVLSAFQRDASDLNEIVDIMAATTSRANTDVEQMGSAMEFVAPVAESMGVSIRETAAGIAILSNAGLQGQKAGTGLRRVITELAAPSDKLASAMGGLTLEADGLVPVLRQLAGSSLSASDAMQIFGQRGGPAFNVLRNGAASAEDFAAALQDVEGAARLIAETRLDNLSGDAREFGSAMAELGIKIGRSGLIEDLRGLTQGLTELARGEGAAAVARNLVPVMKELLFLVSALAAARFGAPALAALATSATAASGTINLLSSQLGTARGRFVLAGRAARAFSGVIGALGGPVGLAILGAIAVVRLVNAETDLERASEKAEKAQKRLNDEIERSEKASQDAVLAAADAQRELVRQLEEGQLSKPIFGALEASPQEMIDRVAEARDRLAELEEQVANTNVALDAFGGAGPPLSELMRDSADSVLEAEDAVQRLEDATKRLSERQENALESARSFARAQEQILRAQFEAEAPGLEEDRRVEREREVTDQIEQLQRELHDEERRIATQTAGERLFLLKATLSDEKAIARGRIAIRQDLAREELQIERAKFDTIRQQLIDSINEEKTLRQQAVDAFDLADEIEKEARDAGKSQRQLIDEAALAAMRASGQEAIDLWKQFVDLGGDAFRGARNIRQEAKKLEEDADKAGEETATIAEEFRKVQVAIRDAEQSLRALTENIDLKTDVSVDDTEFRAFLAELATPSEHTVRIKTEETRREGGPILRRATGGRVPGGYGGGDKVRALLEPGEFVIRKEAVSRYGADWMAALNHLRLDPPPIRRQAGGPVGDVGGAARSPAREVVDVNLNIGGESVPLSGERDAVERLVRGLKGMQSSLAGGVS